LLSIAPTAQKMVGGDVFYRHIAPTAHLIAADKDMPTR